jgi:hypothetical protein
MIRSFEKRIENMMQAPVSADSVRTGVFLSDQPNSWPQDAWQAYKDVLAELNAWSRETGCRSVTNATVAMQAVREAWRDSSPW